MRRPEDIMINGVTLAKRIEQHGLWTRGEGGERLAQHSANAGVCGGVGDDCCNCW